MTKNIWMSSMIVAAALSVGSVMADEPAAPAAAAPAASAPAANSGKHPCKALRQEAIQACTAAKYVKGGHKTHMGLFDDCVKPILEGKGAPAGVTVDQTLVAACQSKKASKK